MEDYAIKHPSKAVTAFAQFQSTNSKDKILEAYKVGACQRCCNSAKYKHK